jgi:DNA-binding YbaB/EbfC family protein
MFGDMSGMMSKLKEAQQKVEETKIHLNIVLVDESSADGKLKITLTANREIKSISIDKTLLTDVEELEDYLILTLNKALQKASEINENEMAIAAKSGMPNIPGMDMFK